MWWGGLFAAFEAKARGGVLPVGNRRGVPHPWPPKLELAKGVNSVTAQAATRPMFRIPF